jgi:hypothetical protein
MAAKPKKTDKPAASAAPALPEYQIESWPLSKLTPYDRNARTHPREQIEQLRQSIKTFGFVQPILVREDGTIIAGHGRLEAARKEKLKTVRVIVARGWSEDQCRAFTLIDNRIALNSGWDEDLYRSELSELALVGEFDLAALGFDESELVGLGDFADSPPPEEGEGEPAEQREASSRVRVGPYSIDVAGPMLKGWITKIREECQDDEQKIKLTILQRLGIAA